MKKLLLITGLLLSLSFVYSQDSLAITKQIGYVEKVEGLYIFMACKPVMNYEVLAEIKTVTVGTDYEGCRDQLIKIILKKYPNAEGAILNIPGADLARATVIKFKQ